MSDTKKIKFSNPLRIVENHTKNEGPKNRINFVKEITFKLTTKNKFLIIHFNLK